MSGSAPRTISIWGPPSSDAAFNEMRMVGVTCKLDLGYSTGAQRSYSFLPLLLALATIEVVGTNSSFTRTDSCEDLTGEDVACSLEIPEEIL
jgi:hypothetical protein